MERRSKGNFFTQLIFSKVFIVLGTVFLMLVVLGLAKSLAANYQVNSEMKKLEKQIADLEGQNRDLGEFLNYIQTDDFVAREGRTKLGLKKSGENLVIIKDEDVNKITEIQKQQAEQRLALNNPKPNWQRWIDYFLK